MVYTRLNFYKNYHNSENNLSILNKNCKFFYLNLKIDDGFNHVGLKIDFVESNTNESNTNNYSYNFENNYDKETLDKINSICNILFDYMLLSSMYEELLEFEEFINFFENFKYENFFKKNYNDIDNTEQLLNYIYNIYNSNLNQNQLLFYTDLNLNKRYTFNFKYNNFIINNKKLFLKKKHVNYMIF